jgi:hypothetical protein
MEASGSLGKAIVFSRWKGRPYVRSLVRPHNPRSPGQTSNREMLHYLSQAWSTLTDEQQASWNTLAAAAKTSPFNQYVAFNQRNWMQAIPPVPTPDTVRQSTPSTKPTITATPGLGMMTIGITPQGGPYPDAVLIFRDAETFAVPTQQMLIAIVPYALCVNPYVDHHASAVVANFYMATQFSADGVMSAPSDVVNGGIANVSPEV